MFARVRPAFIPLFSLFLLCLADLSVTESAAASFFFFGEAGAELSYGVPLTPFFSYALSQTSCPSPIKRKGKINENKISLTKDELVGLRNKNKPAKSVKNER